MISADAEKHKHIQKNLQSLLSGLQKREPLDPSYDALLPASIRKHIKSTNTNKDGAAASKTGKKSSNVLTADVKLHRRLNANLRSTVETFGSTPAGWRRRPNARNVHDDFGSGSDGQTKSSSNKNNNNAQNSNNLNTNNEELESKLRAAFALRESKEHEQRDLVNATLKAENAKMRRGWGLSLVTGAGAASAMGAGAGMGGQPMMGMLPPMEEASVRKKRLEGVAKMLRDVEKGAVERAQLRKIADRGRDMIFNPNTKLTSLVPRSSPESSSKSTPGILLESSSAKSTPAQKRKRQDSEAEDTIEQQIAQAKKRERGLRERIDRQEAENKRRLEEEREERERRERAVETPRDALHRIYEPIFNSLWDMEFANLGGTNPFRMVIDAKTCVEMGIPDYCQVIEKPMNLTYIQTKVNNKSYETLQEFVEDVELIVTNCIKYNHHPDNVYGHAAKELRKRFKKMMKPVVQSLTKGKYTT